jgi:DNA repair exonuclease SbcCD ATPase subunit
MARLHHVRKARKNNKAHGVRKGEPYWWASFRTGGRFIKRYWTSKPRRSSLTQSEYYAALWDAEDDLQDFLKTLDHSLDEKEDEDQGSDEEDAASVAITGWAEMAAEAVETAIGSVEDLKDDVDGKISNLESSFPGSNALETLQERSEELDTLLQGLEEARDRVDNAESIAGIEDEINSISWP